MVDTVDKMVLEVFAAALALDGIRRWVRYLQHIHGSTIRTRHHPAPHVATAVLIVVAALALVPGFVRRMHEDRFARVVSELAGRDVDVHCQTLEDTIMDSITKSGFAGWVEVGSDGTSSSTTLIRDMCSTLKRFEAGDGLSSDETFALQVLTHEAMHLRGEYNEAVTECQAVQRVAITAEKFGATHEQGIEAAAFVVAEFWPNTPKSYLTPDCVAGGVLDERLGNGPWLD